MCFAFFLIVDSSVGKKIFKTEQCAGGGRRRFMKRAKSCEKEL